MHLVFSESSFAETQTSPEVSLKSESLKPIKVQLKWLHQFQFAGYYMALEKGYYRAFGLDVQLIERNPDSVPIDRLLSDNVDFVVADAGVLIYRSMGVPVVALAAVFQQSPLALLTRSDVGIKTLEDMKGKKLRISRGFNDIELRSMLGTANLTVNDFAQVVSTQSIEEFIQGSIDGLNIYTTNEPFKLLEEGINFQVFQPKDYGVDFYGDVLITTETIIESDPAMVDEFRKATLKGWRDAVTNPEEAIDLILNKYNTQQKSREFIEFEAKETIKLILPSVVPIGFMSRDRWHSIEAIFKKQGKMNRDINYDRFIYIPPDERSLLSVLKQYTLEIAAGGLILLSIFVAGYIWNLRIQVQKATEDIRLAKNKAEKEARTDTLTDLPNRRHFMEVFTRDVEQAQRHGLPFSLILADIDHFKNVNDNYGHAAGDESLKEVGKVLRSNARLGDCYARVGGEEFVIGCPNTSEEQARLLAERLCKALESKEVMYENKSLRLTMSFGLSSLSGEESKDELFNHADEALYSAKQGGRNRVEVYKKH
ncbi:ABC transporter substrate-binding protein [Litoribacillus peritrichatus]|uniref:ABC transporter substrate-binding protein n=1 Tax=Litoribacillus peritrichatus TaxID=718191 RepID=UPI0031DAEF43